MGKYDSSLTRVQPFFDQLLDRDPAGAEWLPLVLRAMPRAEVIPEGLLNDPGQILPELAQRNDGRRHCFEYPVPPSEPFLRWLIQHPEELSWPRGAAGEFGPTATEWRRRLIHGTPEAQRQAMNEGLRQLGARGVKGSRRQPWAFEGWTNVDCCLKTTRLTLFVEGKRKEELSPSTAWFPARNQLIRNLEVVASLRPETPGFVLLATEDENTDAPNRGVLRASAPHLESTQLDALWDRYLGQITWRELCNRVDVAFDSLPDTVTN